MSEKAVKGRPPKYKPEYDDQAYHLCKLGAVDKDIAAAMKVTEQTINNWKIDYPSFFESIKKGKDYFDTEKVESALLRSAQGYEVVETKEVEGAKGTETTKTVKHVAPHPTSIIFYLTNRQRGRWSRNVEPTIERESAQAIEFTRASDANTSD